MILKVSKRKSDIFYLLGSSFSRVGPLWKIISILEIRSKEYIAPGKITNLPSLLTTNEKSLCLLL